MLRQWKPTQLIKMGFEARQTYTEPGSLNCRYNVGARYLLPKCQFYHL